MKSDLFSRKSAIWLLSSCAGILFSAGCTVESEIPLPPGAYVSDPVEPIPREVSAQSVLPGDSEPVPISFPSEEEDMISPFLPAEETEKDPVLVPSGATKAKPAAVASDKKADDIIYVVRKNDSLGKIAQKYHTKASTLADYNGISLQKPILPGQKIRIPADLAAAAPATAAAAAPATAAAAGQLVYTVKKNDSLGSIAQAHGVRTADLAEINKIDVKKPIYPGQKLVIPGKKAAPAPAAKTASAPAAKTSSAPAAKTSSAPAPAAKKQTPAATAKTSSAPAAKPAEPKQEKAAEAKPKDDTLTGDDILKSIGNDDAAAKTSSAPAPAAKQETASKPAPAPEPVIDPGNSISISIDREMTLEEAAKAFDRSYQAVRQLNPSISPDQRMKAGTLIQIPIF